MKNASAVFLTGVALAVSPALASADSTIRTPGDHPDYHVDIEPHGVLGLAWWDFGPYNYYGGIGFGGGARFSIPLCKNCFIPKINNNVAISFGADFVIWPFGAYNYVFTDLFLPVVMQWNFFVAKKWSVGPELGFAPVIGVFYDYAFCSARAGCQNWWIYPDLAVVARYHFSDKVALTMRLGFPEFFNIGVSFLL